MNTFSVDTNTLFLVHEEKFMIVKRDTERKFQDQVIKYYKGKNMKAIKTVQTYTGTWV